MTHAGGGCSFAGLILIRDLTVLLSVQLRTSYRLYCFSVATSGAVINSFEPLSRA